jgi:hypothetical protein
VPDASAVHGFDRALPIAAPSAIATAARALASVAQLAQAGRALDAAGIQWLAYKGPALAVQAYGDLSGRDWDDLDVVVRASELDAAAATLMRIGYAPPRELGWSAARRAHRWHGQVTFVREGAIPIDLHWRFCGRRLPWNPEFDALNGRSVVLNVGGIAVRTTAIDDTLLLVLLHAARHGWDSDEALASVRGLIAHGANSDTVLVRAGACGGTRAAAVGLIAAERAAGGSAAPGETGNGIGRIAGEALVNEALQRVRAGGAGDRRDAGLHLRTLDRASDRLRYAVMLALEPTDRDFAVVSLTPGLHWLYVPIHLGRLFLRSIGLARRS